MTHRSPLVTLAGLVVAFGTMFGINLASSAPPGEYAQPGSDRVTDDRGEHQPAGATPRRPPRPAAPRRHRSDPTDDDDDADEADESEFPAKIVYAGRTRDGSAAIAVAIRGQRAAAYLCDGRNVEAWLTGTVDGDEIELRGKDGTRLKAELDDGRLEGRLERKGDRCALRGRRGREARRPLSGQGFQDHDRLDRAAGRQPGRHPDHRRVVRGGPGTRSRSASGRGRRREPRRPTGHRRRRLLRTVGDDHDHHHSPTGAEQRTGHPTRPGPGRHGDRHRGLHRARRLRPSPRRHRSGHQSGRLLQRTGGQVGADHRGLRARHPAVDHRAGMFGRIPLTGAWVGPVHRWSGRVAVAVTVPVAVHCLYALGFEDYDTRVADAFDLRLLLLRRLRRQDVDLDPGRFAEVGAAGARRRGLQWTDRAVARCRALVLRERMITSDPRRHAQEHDREPLCPTDRRPSDQPPDHDHRRRRGLGRGGRSDRVHQLRRPGTGRRWWRWRRRLPARAAGRSPPRPADIPVGGGKSSSTRTSNQHAVITQPTAGEFKAFSSICTHAQCDVSEVTTTIKCTSCHQSEFSITDGSVVKPPASSPAPAEDDQGRRRHHHRQLILGARPALRQAQRTGSPCRLVVLSVSKHHSARRTSVPRLMLSFVDGIFDRLGADWQTPTSATDQTNRGRWWASWRCHHSQSWLTSWPQRSSSWRIPLSCRDSGEGLGRGQGAGGVGLPGALADDQQHREPVLQPVADDHRADWVRSRSGWRNRSPRHVRPMIASCPSRSCRTSRWPAAPRRRAAGRTARRGRRPCCSRGRSTRRPGWCRRG